MKIYSSKNHLNKMEVRWHFYLVQTTLSKQGAPWKIESKHRLCNLGCLDKYVPTFLIVWKSNFNKVIYFRHKLRNESVYVVIYIRTRTMCFAVFPRQAVIKVSSSTTWSYHNYRCCKYTLHSCSRQTKRLWLFTVPIQSVASAGTHFGNPSVHF